MASAIKEFTNERDAHINNNKKKWQVRRVIKIEMKENLNQIDVNDKRNLEFHKLRASRSNLTSCVIWFKDQAMWPRVGFSHSVSSLWFLSCWFWLALHYYKILVNKSQGVKEFLPLNCYTNVLGLALSYPNLNMPTWINHCGSGEFNSKQRIENKMGKLFQRKLLELLYRENWCWVAKNKK